MEDRKFTCHTPDHKYHNAPVVVRASTAHEAATKYVDKFYLGLFPTKVVVDCDDTGAKIAFWVDKEIKYYAKMVHVQS